MHVGDVIDGKYELVELIGEGGMGSVFEVRHRRIGRRLALKALHPRFVESSEMVERFVREAQAAAAIGSEHIVEVTDAGVTPEGVHYLIMEYLEGQTLSEVLADEGPLEPRRAIDLVMQVCEGLEAAHQAGIIHRDLKPGNLVVTRRQDGSEWVKVVDFGVAKVRDALPTMATQTPELTGTTATLGTPYYMAPEQAWGSKRATARSDVYAAGVVLFELLTGARPFRADSYNELIVRIATEDPPSPRSVQPELSEALEAVILKAMARDHDERYSSMGELAQALAAVTGTDAGGLGSTCPERLAAKRRPSPPVVTPHDKQEALELANTAPAGSEYPETGAEPEPETETETEPEAEGESEPESSVKAWRHRGVLLAVIGAALAVSGLAVFGAIELVRGGGWTSLMGVSDSPDAARGGGSGPWGDGVGPGARDGGGARDGDVDALDVDADMDGQVDGDMPCPVAMVRNEDTWGHCCWPAQVWSKSRGECIGEPDCPGGTAWRGGACVCPEGKSITIDTRENCCWPSQAWSMTQEQCVGPVRCPLGFKTKGALECEPDEGTALGRLISGCQLGKVASCVDLGMAYRGGSAADRAHAVILYCQGCEGGDARGCLLLGDALVSGRGVERSAKKASVAFLQACIGGEADACTKLGSQYQQGQGVDESDGRAAAFFRRGCDAGHFVGCVRLGELLAEGRDAERGEARAAKLFERACNEGVARGCFKLAEALEKGRGVPVDHHKAFELSRETCHRGEAGACRLVGTLLRHGRGVNVDHGLAVRYAERACNGGDAPGCRDLGLLLQRGIGIRQNFDAAAKAYRKACEGGDALGCRNLAIRYRRGEGVPLDHNVAVRWYERACTAGDALACGLAGDLYLNSTTVRRDAVKGMDLLRRGCETGDQWSCKRVHNQQ